MLGCVINLVLLIGTIGTGIGWWRTGDFFWWGVSFITLLVLLILSVLITTGSNLADAGDIDLGSWD